ncbi:MAG: hypothetical protein IIA92_07260 [Chloroflexi bacterium]|nr:hypothetical protein [Chloroflexota bacterium]
MPESFDVYTDSFQVNIGAWGATINFSLSSNNPPAPGSQPQSAPLGTVRTSLEHLKVMTFMLKRQISQFESSQQITIELPTQVLSATGIPMEDWDAFWKQA